MMAVAEEAVAAREAAELAAVEAELVAARERLRLYEDPPPFADLNIAVDGFRWHGSGLARHCRYQVTREYKGMRLPVFRRFSDFVTLYRKLIKQHSFCLVPHHPDKSLAASLSTEACEERLQWVQAFLTAVVAHPTLSTSDWLRSFLVDQTEVWQRRIDGPRKASQLLSQAKQRALGMLGVPSEPAQMPASSSSSEEDDEEEGQPEDEETSNGGLNALWALRNLALGGGSEPLPADGSVTRVQQSLEGLCASPGPLVASRKVIFDAAQESIDVRIERARGRLEASDRFARAFLAFLRAADHRATEAAAAARALQALAGAPPEAPDRGTPASEHALLTRLAGALFSVKEGADALARDVKSREAPCLELALAASLKLRGAEVAVQRLDAESRRRQQHGQQQQQQQQQQQRKESTVPENVARRLEDAEQWSRNCDSLASELEAADADVRASLGTAAVRLAQAQIAQAQANRAALTKVLQWLEPEEGGAARRNLLGVGASERVWEWGPDTPM